MKWTLWFTFVFWFVKLNISNKIIKYPNSVDSVKGVYIIEMKINGAIPELAPIAK